MTKKNRDALYGAIILAVFLFGGLWIIHQIEQVKQSVQQPLAWPTANTDQYGNYPLTCEGIIVNECYPPHSVRGYWSPPEISTNDYYPPPKTQEWRVTGKFTQLLIRLSDGKVIGEVSDLQDFGVWAETNRIVGRYATVPEAKKAIEIDLEPREPIDPINNDWRFK